ncbi:MULTISPECIES: helix-turn-helix transcriptional regulator [unclassified Paraburkholderia]|uniref:helix-turn-helix transcriptional regulator n=1 Tax=unclassified Paraburkholderia TaxID=2615204 RepID=UPI001F11B973|nr:MULTISPECIES: AraC family transcriptional regulator [unclassified Paraburkholderia]MBN3853499.1 AraC family transcriptional regulator [Paraburkholderia sp. Ac-20340]
MHDLLTPAASGHSTPPQTLAQMVAHFSLLEPLFDAMPDVVFFVKDHEARYVIVNATLAARCGYKDRRALLGKTAAEAFPSRFGRIYTEQDEAVVRDNSRLIDQLELHLYPGRQPGWCLTSKVPLQDAQGRVLGVAGISRDLRAAEGTHPAYQRVAIAAKYIQDNYAQPLKLSNLAALIDMSVAQVERYFHKVFHLTPRQMLLKTRLDAASELLASDSSITDIATRCGYNDHSAFTRQFKATVGITPSQYRALLHPQAAPSDQ